MNFEFNESVASNLMGVIARDILQMDNEAASFEQKASENEQLASQKEAEANSEEASIHHYKTETRTRTVTDDDGNTTTEEYDVSVIDEEADAASLARAAALRAEATALKAIASTLRGVAASLRSTSSATGVQQQQFTQAITTTQLAIATTNLLLKEGMNIIGQVKSAFNVPQTDNKVEWAKNVGTNLLKIVGIDLSDGLNDEIYTAIGITTQLRAIAGTVALNSAVSVIGTKMGVGILGNLGRQALKIESQKIKDKYLNQTGAKVAQNAIASALTLHGINALPTVKEQAGNTNAELEDIPVIDITEFAKYADTDKTATNTTTQGTTQADVGTVKENFTKTTNQNSGTTVQQTELSDEAKKKLEDENEKWKAREEYDENRLSEAKNDITRYSNNIKNGNKNISEIDDSIKKKQATIDANKKEYDAKHEEFGKSKMGIDYDGLRKDMENIKKENAQLEKDINLLEKRKELINKNIETWEKNKNTAENVAKSLGGKYEKKA